MAAKLATEAGSRRIPVVSGGARGIDEAALLGALQCNGIAIGVLADSLLRAATSAKYRKHLMADNLVLVSSFNPEAGFDVGNAMARNRYIYCLADAAVVVSSTRDKGGSWAGAIENLKERWVPLWVGPSLDPGSGNADLVQRGARWLPDQRPELAALFPVGEAVANGAAESQRSLLDYQAATPMQAHNAGVETPDAANMEDSDVSPTMTAAKSEPWLRDGSIERPDSYEQLLARMKILAAHSPLTVEQLLDRLDVAKALLRTWLARAVTERRIKKLSKPVRYRWQDAYPEQHSMFGDDEAEQTPKRMRR